MKTIILSLLILLTFTSASQEKKQRIENKIMDCIYNSFDDKGVAFKKVMIDYESYLIENNFLKDRTGKSYKDAFKKIALDNDFKSFPQTNLNNYFNETSNYNIEKILPCETIIKDSTKYNTSTFLKMEIMYLNLSKQRDLNPTFIANSILGALNENDFELEYYKLGVFNMFNILDRNQGILESLPSLKDVDKQEYDLSNTLDIKINSKNELFVDGKKSDIKELKAVVIKYYKKNKSESVIIIQYSRKTFYKKYIEVQHEIISARDAVREGLANKLFGKAYEDLSKIELKDIKNIYPFNLIEQETTYD